jgi:hypothetical protein
MRDSSSGTFFFPRTELNEMLSNKSSPLDSTIPCSPNTATAGTTGYRVIGDLSKLKVAGAGEKAGELGFLENKDAAFTAGIDLYRNPNGTFSVNPTSTILKESNARRVPNNLIVDFEKGGAIVDKATPGLADLASKGKPLEVRGNTVLAGDLNPIRVGMAFNPLDEDYLAVQARYIWASGTEEYQVARSCCS